MRAAPSRSVWIPPKSSHAEWPSSSWRPVVDTRRSRHRPSPVYSGGLISLFLDNIPEKMMARDLYSFLNKFVNVLDVFIPGRRHMVSKSRFGFAKVRGSADADLLIKKVNGLWFLNQMLSVKEAHLVRTSTVKGRGLLSMGHRPHQEPKMTLVAVRDQGSHSIPHRKSYADVLRGHGRMIPYILRHRIFMSRKREPIGYTTPRSLPLPDKAMSPSRRSIS
ncbi:hypothetical protein Dimus_023322 [Dionaea muscipula]